MPCLADVLTYLVLAQAQQGNAPGQSGLGAMASMLFPFLMIAVLFYLLIIRPERRKRAELAGHAAEPEEERPSGYDWWGLMARLS